MTSRFFRFWLPVVLWMLLIFTASTGAGRPTNTSRFLRPLIQFFKPDITEEQFAEVHYAVRKTGHFLEYAILAVLLWRALRSESSFEKIAASKQFVAVLVLCAIYASTDEYHQRFVSGREASVHDVILDSFGAAFGMAVYGLGLACRKKPN